ncbi:MAG: hypothetical protein ABSC94_03875 [Polyangiaceae bacterium]
MRLAAHPSLVRFALFIATLCVAGCDGPGRVQYDAGHCLRDGRALTTQDVEVAQADVARRIASRQPWFAVITIGVVLLAAASNAEKGLLLIRARRVDDHRPLTDALREVLARQRDSPVRFAVIVGGSLALIAIAGAAYIYLDIEKRTSERALGMLQFCHLALRTEEEERALSEQQHNLESIESTAGDIRALVGKLPPDQQRKAQLIVEQMNSALAKQGKIVGEYVARTDEAQKDLSAHTTAMEKGLASVEDRLADLRSVPTNLKDLESAAHRIDETTTTFDGRFVELRSRITDVDIKLDTLLARPPCSALEPKPPPKASAAATASAAAAKPPARAMTAQDGGTSMP